MTNARPAGSDRLLRAIAAVSGIYDVLLGIAMLLGRGLLQSGFGLPPPAPPIHADLNGVFLLAVGAGYGLAWRQPRAWRGYFWVMGPFLKGLGAAALVADHLARSSPAAFLLFALSDGCLAVVTLWALWRTRGLAPR